MLVREAHFEVRGFPWPLYALWDERGHLLKLSFGKERPSLKGLERHLGRLRLFKAKKGQILDLQALLEAYFLKRTQVLHYPLRVIGSPFEISVWQKLKEIPYGEVRTYGWLACQIARPKAARAVGQALGKNPLPLFIPCHRIVAVKGLGGYAGGLKVKEFLLSLEGNSLPEPRQ